MKNTDPNFHLKLVCKKLIELSLFNCIICHKVGIVSCKKLSDGINMNLICQKCNTSKWIEPSNGVHQLYYKLWFFKWENTESVFEL